MNKPGQSRLPPADHCVLAVKFTNHNFSSLAYASWTRDRVHCCHGGVSSLAKLINGLEGAP